MGILRTFVHSLDTRCPKVPKVPKLPKIAQCAQKCQKFSRASKSAQKRQKSAQSCQTSKNSVLNFFGTPRRFYRMWIQDTFGDYFEDFAKEWKCTMSTRRLVCMKVRKTHMHVFPGLHMGPDSSICVRAPVQAPDESAHTW